jgi:hypothetical protein
MSRQAIRQYAIALNFFPFLLYSLSLKNCHTTYLLIFLLVKGIISKRAGPFRYTLNDPNKLSGS